MSFLRPNNRSSRSARVFVAIALFAAVVFAINYVTNGTVSRLARAPLAPLSSAESAVRAGFSERSLLFKGKAALQQENIALQGRITELELLALNNLALKTENDELRELVRVRPQNGTTRHTVRVLSHAGSFPYGTLIIDNPGKALAPGAFVYAAGGVAVGTVLDEKGANINVHLLSASGRHTQALVGEERIPVELIGLGQGNFSTEIPRGVAVEVGDHVVLPEAHGALLGVVGSVEVKDTDAFQTVLVRIPVSISNIQFVSL